MKFMVMIKPDPKTEAEIGPNEKCIRAMGEYHQELVKAGVLLAGEALHPIANGARVRISGDKRTVMDGPFTESKELVAGFWIFEVNSQDEAVEWVKRMPNPLGGESEIEIRQVYEAADFGDMMPPEVKESEERWRSGKQEVIRQ